MGGLISAEFRKTTTTGLWWGLMIPTVLLALGWSLGTGALLQSIGEALTSEDGDVLLGGLLGVSADEWKLSVFGITRSINIATIFPMIFGGLAIAGEFNRKTITTTFLTAPNRVSAMTAKLVVYLAWGAIYGLIIVTTVSIGISLTADSGQLPEAGGWFALCAVGVLSTMLMTMFGVGVGALLNSTVGTTVVLVLYMLVIENALQLVLQVQDLSGVIAFLPNGAANGITGGVAADVFMGNVGVVPDGLKEVLMGAAGAAGALDWWLSTLVFLGWTAVFFAGGWAVTQKKDIT